MSQQTPTWNIGRDGFVWWMGVVEDVSDPMKLGRAKVRIVGWHDEEQSISTYDLPWAYPLLPVTGNKAVPNYRPGDWVAGFFMDGIYGQQPIILGIFPAIAQPDAK